MACPGRLLSQTLLSPLWMCKVRVQSRLLVAACTRALQPIIPTASWMCTHAHSSTCACPSGRHQCMATRLTGLSRSAHAARTTRERWCQVESASQSAAAPRSGCAAPTAPRGPPARPRPPPGAPPDAAARAAPARGRAGPEPQPRRRPAPGAPPGRGPADSQLRPLAAGGCKHWCARRRATVLSRAPPFALQGAGKGEQPL